MGGMHGFGPVIRDPSDRAPDEPPFHEPWEAVAFAMKRPVAQPLLPELREDRLSPAQHRALFTGIRAALAEIRGLPDAPFAITLHVGGRC